MESQVTFRISLRRRFLHSFLLLATWLGGGGFCVLLAEDWRLITIDPSKACCFHGGSLPSQLRIGETFDLSNESAGSELKDCLEQIGLTPRFLVAQADVPSATAVIHNDRRLILTNIEAFVVKGGLHGAFIPHGERERTLLDMYYRGEMPWKIRKQVQAGFVYSWIAQLHEIGHHLNGHTLEGGGKKRKQFELEADRFAGHLCVKFFLQGPGGFLDFFDIPFGNDGTQAVSTSDGAFGLWRDPDTKESLRVRFDPRLEEWFQVLTLEKAKEAISAFTTDYETETHPAKAERLGAFEEGWRKAIQAK